MLLIENIKLALTSIRTNKMRSFLTMLGIIIGISSVIAITSIGASAKGVVSKEFESFGMNNMYVYINWRLAEDGVEYSDLIFPEDIEALKERFPDDILYICPSISADSETKVRRITGKLRMAGVAADYNKFYNMNLIHGRMLNESDVDGARDRIVIDKDAAQHFFNKDNAVGEVLSVTINGEPKDLTIVGIYEKEASIFDNMMVSDSYQTYVPYPLLQAGDQSTSYIELYTNAEKDQAVIGGEITKYLARIKDKAPEFYIFESAEAQMGMINNVLGTLSIAIGAIAAISLVVGGIGIMNIMLVSVTERTREIGIRKSLGARTKDILLQFLIESMIISAIGGVIGTLLGVGIASIGMSFANISVIIEPGVIVLAVAFSALVGMFFGLYPARKAAKLDPIEALRYE
ncbi:ABC transporter permease [Sinanaerobacter chloroacetimidivorans]|uniref:ABC transporter permease n=1 Tax=Sinanaerobacter chloroacetimidivorans TaxID=2818044 RepID=A0A8J8B0Y8_9FIRM|nr:ABC transporter permease [Sinanaerobacter chloroacetimidivorans]MBR0597116.1 ABC transporter permease [Sinanaerobacter chloroacetimidivorans]